MHTPPSDEVPFGLGFPYTLTRFAMGRPRTVIAAFAALAVLSVGLAARVHEAEDLLDFIPPGDPDVKAFREVGRTFGALRVALVGIEARPGDDVFSPDALGRLAAATEAVKGVRGVDSVDSLTAVEDFVPSAAGVEVRPLIEAPPASPEARRALRERVLSRDHVVGNLVSRDGRAALLLVYLAEGASDRITSREIRRAVEGAIGDLRAVYGGAPFAAAAIYEETQADVLRLTPLAVLVLLGLILIAFRDPLGVLLTIVTVAWSAAVVLGVMALLHEPFTAASGTLPVLLFASGTSYAVHVLGRYYLLEPSASAAGRRPTRGEDAARLLTAVRIVGPPVAIASFTTAAGFTACVVMDIRPLRAFGIECAGGVILAMVAAFLLVPAVLALIPRGRHEPVHTGRVGALLAALSDWSQAHRRLVLGLGAAAAIGGFLGTLGLQVRMEPRAFFRPGSDPWLAERFLAERFGGSQMLMVSLQGDFTEPATLHEVQRLEEFARSLPGVTQANAIVEPLALLNDVMGGGKRLPETQRQVQNLLFFLEGRASLKRLMSPARDRALVHIRVRAEGGPVIAAVEDYLAHRLATRPGGPTRESVAERVRWSTQAAGDPIADDALERILQAARPVPPDDARLTASRREIARALLTGESELLPSRRPGNRVTPPGGTLYTIAELADAFALDTHRLDRGSPRRADVLSLAPSPEEGELAWSFYVEQVAARARELSVDDALAPAGPLPSAAMPAIRQALGDLFPAQPIARATRPITAALAGEPILERGMSRSVQMNHRRSTIVAWIAVMIVSSLYFRSLRLALISVVPSALTMLVVFGSIALAGYRIDLGSSLVTAIATGAGSEFAMQYLWYLKRSTPQDVVRFVGPIMVISTLLIAAGFAVLGLGNAQPMRMFGVLAALSMLGAGGFTFLLVPALIRRVDSNRAQPGQEVA